MPRTFAPSAAAVALLLAASPHARAESWSLIALPDTQHYVSSFGDNQLNDALGHGEVDTTLLQTQWIADQLGPRNIKFVTHLGDLVENGQFDPSHGEWTTIDASMDVLHGVVPYATLPGNHDYDRTSETGGVDPFTGIDAATHYTSLFGPSRYAGQAWYGGASPDGKNSYQLFSAGGRQFLHLSVEWEAPGSASDPTTALGWAKSVLNAHPNTPTILSTHSFLWDLPGSEGVYPDAESQQPTPADPALQGNSGTTIFDELIDSHDQVFMVLNGHYSFGAGDDNGEVTRTLQNSFGSDVYAMLSNYQDRRPWNTGDTADDLDYGYLRIIEFIPGGGVNGLDRIFVQTYSPATGQSMTDGNSEFFFDLDFNQRLGIPEPAAGAVLLAGLSCLTRRRRATLPLNTVTTAA